MGIPTHNRAPLLAKAIDSILGQTYPNVELIISDNASTDQTEAICRGCAARDSRVRYIQQQNNIGSARNFDEVLRLARGDYFVWLADDDWCHKRFIEVLLFELQARPDVILCASDVKVVDANGNDLGEERLERIYPNIPWEKARLAFFEFPISNVVQTVYGLYRTSILKTFGAPRGVTRRNILTNSEVPFLAKLATVGRIMAIPEVLRYYRNHEDSACHLERGEMNPLDFCRLRLMVMAKLGSTLAMSGLGFGEKVKIGIHGTAHSVGRLVVWVGRRTGKYVSKAFRTR